MRTHWGMRIVGIVLSVLILFIGFPKDAFATEEDIPLLEEVLADTEEVEDSSESENEIGEDDNQFQIIENGDFDEEVIEIFEPQELLGGNPFGGGFSNCTYGTWQYVYERTGIELPMLGDAGQWYANAQGYGYEVNPTTPLPPCVAVWDHHVAFVDSVSGGQMHVLSGGYLGGPEDRWVSTGSVLDAGTQYAQNLKGFIYLNHRPNGVVNVIEPKGDGKFHVSGWAFDWDNTSKALTIHVYVGTESSSSHTTPDYTCTANIERSDISSYGAGTKHGFDATFTTTKTGNQAIYIYAIDALGGDNFNSYLAGDNGKTIYISSDTQKPVVSNVKCLSINKDGYKLQCTVSDNKGVTKVNFSTCTLASGKTDWKDYYVTPVNNVATCTIKTSDFSNRQGQYYTDIYAYDASNNKSDWKQEATYYPIIDRTPPVLSEAKASWHTLEEGHLSSYTVSFDAEDTNQIVKVEIGTSINGGDAIWKTVTSEDSHYETEVSIEDYECKLGIYKTTIRATDTFGNISTVTLPEISMNGEILEKDVPTEGIPDGPWVAGIDPDGYEYTGKAVVPSIRVYHRTKRLAQGTDYSLNYKNNIERGIATIEVKGKNNYSNTAYVDFQIVSKSIGDGVNFDPAFQVSIADKKYTGGELISKPVIKLGTKTLKENQDYTLSFSGDQTSVGTVTITVSGIRNFKDSAKIKYKIYEEGMSLTKAVLSIPAEENLTYTGSQVKPVVNVKVSAGDNSFLDKKFYDVSYVNNTNVGKATATVKGKNGYSGTKSISFTIKAKPVSVENMTISVATSTYTGTAVKPDITVIDKSAGLVDSTNYTVTYKNNTNAAEETATNPKTGKSIAPEVTVKFKGNYSGSISKPFAIKPTSLTGEDLAITFSDIKDTGRSVINAQSLKPTIKYGKKTLSKGKDYEIEFERASDKEIQTAIVKLIGNYTGSIPCKFRIYTEKNDFSKGDYAVGLVTDNITYTGRKISPEVRVTTTIDGGTFTLVPGKDYTISYSNNTKAANSTDKVAPTWKVTGKGAYKGTLTGGFTIKPATFSDAKFRVTVANVKFNGKDQKPKVTVVECASGKVLKSSDYTAVYDSTKNAATEDVKVTITGRGNYEGTLTGHFRVYGKDISGVTVEKIKNVSYTGKQITPNGSDVKVYADKKKTIPLQEGVHYTLTYGTNLKAGAGSVILNGLGEYGGVKTVKFTIIPKWLQWVL